MTRRKDSKTRCVRVRLKRQSRACKKWLAAKWDAVWTLGSTAQVDRMKNWLPVNSPPSEAVMKVYEEIYRVQIQFRENLPVRLQIPLAIALSLLTAQGFLFFAAGLVKVTIASTAFCLSLLGAFALVFFAGVVFFRISSGHLYQYLPTPREMEDFRARIEVHYRGNPAYAKSTQTITDLSNQWAEKDIFRHYVVCTSVNAALNAIRSKAVFAVHRVLLVAIVLTIVAFIAFVLGDLKDQPIHRAQVELVEKVGPNRPVVIFQGIRSADVNVISEHSR